jgi:RND superfamily putative drug exporter
MLTRLAGLVSARPRRVLGATAAFFVLAVVFGAAAPGLLRGGHDFEDPGSEAATVRERLERVTGMGNGPGLIALVEPGAPIDSPVARAKVEKVSEVLARDPAVAEVGSYYDSRSRDQVARDGSATYVTATFRDLDAPALEDAASRIDDALAGTAGVRVGGRHLVGVAVGDQVGKDLARAEALAFPIILALSFVFFRGLVAALLPSFVGVLTIFGSFLGLRVLNEVQPLSVFAVNLVIALGLGLAIDYSLFIVSRYREELARSGPGPRAILRTLQTAGRTVLFSALTVAAALASLLVFPLRFLYSMGLGGMLAALIAAAVSLVALPALLVLLGRRVDALAPRRLQRANQRVADGERGGFWDRLARAVMRHPALVAGVTSIVLLAVGSQFLRIQFTGIAADVLPTDSAPRQVDEALRTKFPPSPTSPVTVTARAPAGARAAVSDLAGTLARMDGVELVPPPSYVGSGLWRLQVIPAERPLAEASKHLVDEIRALDGPLELGVTGQTAEFLDQQASLGKRLPLAIGVLCLTTLALLFAMTGSVVLPIKSLLMNLLTLSAAFGLLVLIFQEGRLEHLLGYTGQGALEATQPVLLFAVAFGLSTDYAVFLLSRIKEARDRGLDDRAAVAAGLERTGRIVTAAALLFTVAIGAFATSRIIFIKEVGVGTALAVLIDATIIRALLVPSLMALLGRWNWWAPPPLRRLHRRPAVIEA